MTTTDSHKFLHCIFIFTCYILISSQDVAQLPFCNEEVKHKELILVSTLDGFLTALSPSGDVSWKIETGPGPLLKSNIHKLELTNNGQWLRIIPSLSGSLYKFDGITIDPIPISADTLLTSSFRYSDDLVIAGGREVRTYGVQLNSGRPLYECSLSGCRNTTDYSDDLDDIIIIERKTHTVRAVEPRTGTERWNFSVGEHNVKIPYVSCIDVNLKNNNFNLSAVLPEGLLIATKIDRFTETLWKHKFDTPIVAVWRWNGREMVQMNLFSPVTTNVKSKATTPSIYVGMHNKQLYVHESSSMQTILQLNRQPNDRHSVVESKSVTQIPWKPVPATSLSSNTVDQEADDSTALSVLYASEYVNGNGYYLYTEEKTVCENNVTNTISAQENSADSILYWWKQAFVIALTTVILCNFVYNYGIFGFGRRQNFEKDIPSFSTKYMTYSRNSSQSESSDVQFISRYTTEFVPISCLGKGGFGVVFQAKKKFDECDYAVKRITLPQKPLARDRMMREVKALAKLDHSNIVRYYNAWLEDPPHGWQQEQDKHWLNDFSVSYLDKSLSTEGLPNKMVSSLAINVEESNSFSMPELEGVHERHKSELLDSSSIVFESNSTTPTALQSSRTCDSVYKSQQVIENHSVNLYQQRPAPVYLYIQMQLCCKESLKDWLHNNPERDRSYSLSIFEQIVDAVEYVHFRGLIHRDLKPSNIFFSLEGQIKVGDFGLVTSIKEYDGAKSDLSTVLIQESYTNAVGTQLYMSPEQLEGRQYDHKVDIYSLGIIFFELLVSFATEMERIRVLTDLRKNIYPTDFTTTFYREYELLNLMLAVDPEERPAANEIRQQLSFQDSTAVDV